MLAVHSPHNPLTPAPRYAKGPGTLRQRTLLAVDDALAAIVRQLKRSGRYDDTYLVVTSDQGLAFGADPSKAVPREGSINVPLIVRGPGVKAGVTLHQLVDHADLAPTILDWTGAPPMTADGRSLAPLLRGAGGVVLAGRADDAVRLLEVPGREPRGLRHGPGPRPAAQHRRGRPGADAEAGRAE
jgi:arylsulfatase A-like enzyme